MVASRPVFSVSFSFRRPAHLGVQNGRLAPCKRTPNCVSSQADFADAEHYVAPIEYRGSMQELRRAVESLPGATVITERENYLYAECRTRLMRFVDDLELAYDAAAGLVHVRSASRLGRRDFGVNRARVEELRRLIRALR